MTSWVTVVAGGMAVLAGMVMSGCFVPEVRNGGYIASPEDVVDGGADGGAGPPIDWCGPSDFPTVCTVSCVGAGAAATSRNGICRMYIDATEAIIPGFVDGLGECIKSPKCGSPLCGCLAMRYPQVVAGNAGLSDEQRGHLKVLVGCVVDYLQGRCDPP